MASRQAYFSKRPGSIVDVLLRRLIGGVPPVVQRNFCHLTARLFCYGCGSFDHKLAECPCVVADTEKSHAEFFR